MFSAITVRGRYFSKNFENKYCFLSVSQDPWYVVKKRFYGTEQRELESLVVSNSGSPRMKKT